MSKKGLGVYDDYKEIDSKDRKTRSREYRALCFI